MANLNKNKGNKGKKIGKLKEEIRQKENVNTLERPWHLNIEVKDRGTISKIKGE